jgi:mannose-1-phosphate guanylyltransferase
MKICPVIIAGGVGTRFWPESRKKRPKQLLHVIDKEKSLLELTIERISHFASLEDTLIITSDYHVEEVAEQAAGVPKANIIAEPIGRNTATCIALAAHILHRTVGDDAMMIVLPADHLVKNENEFTRLIKVAEKTAKETGGLVTLGIHPTRPETGYGYIQIDDERLPSVANIPSLSEFEVRDVFRVKRFAEKPDEETAKRFVESGDFLWNSGMFVWCVGSIRRALEQFSEDISERIGALPLPSDPTFASALKDAYSKIRGNSIDYAVMERASNVYVVRAGAIGWSDVGSWDEVWRLAEKDEAQNAVDGAKVLLRSSKRCLVRSKSDELIILTNVDDLIVIHSGDAILIANRDKAQHVKDVVDYLKRNNQDRYL